LQLTALDTFAFNRKLTYLQFFTLNAVSWMVAVMLLGCLPSQARHFTTLNVGQFAHLRDIGSLRQPFLFTRRLELIEMYVRTPDSLNTK